MAWTEESDAFLARGEDAPMIQDGTQDAVDKTRTPEVAVARCPDYDRERVLAAVRKSVDSLGGIRRFVTSGERILIKPNMLSAKAPEEAVTTHPEVLRAVIKLVKECGATPIVGDSPSGPSTERILRRLAQKTGVQRVCDEERVEFTLFDESFTVSFPNGVAAKSFELTTALKQVSGVVSVAKMKTHTFTVLTGAVKNLFGLIPGLKKAEYHFRMQKRAAFSEMLVDLAECVKPRLTIMDAVVGMEGDGPAGGNLRHIGLILSSANVHALDSVFLALTGAEPAAVPSVATAMRRGLAPADPNAIRIVGEPEAATKLKGFKMPSTAKAYGGIPSALGKVAGEIVSKKPVYVAKRCTRCNACVEICYAQALTLGEKKPRIDRNKCIRCYCCQEVCPASAVLLKRRPARSVGTIARHGISRVGKRT
jgi:uncharacterized protein (DUF362 family)/NAD-dependent dihydropyrimidine dehydrogenase PreA subunit